MKWILINILFVCVLPLKAQLANSGAMSMSTIANYMVTLGEMTPAQRSLPFSIKFLNSLSHLSKKTSPYNISDWYGYYMLPNCKKIKQSFPASTTGIYTVDPDGIGSGAPIKCYCDMDRDGGGWTLVFKRGSGNQVDNEAHTVSNLLILDTSSASFSDVTINTISNQIKGTPYELRLEGSNVSTLMQASEPFYVGQRNNHQYTVKYDCNRDGNYEITKLWNSWTVDRGGAESASWIRDWVFPNNSMCNLHNGGTAMQWWGGGDTETPSNANGSNYGPITESIVPGWMGYYYNHNQPVKLWVR